VVEKLYAAGNAVLSVFAALDRAKVPYCVLHGYDGWPDRVNSDLDCVVSVPAEQVALLFRGIGEIDLDLALVQVKGSCLVFAHKRGGHSAQFLTLDLCSDCTSGGIRYYTGQEVIESRQRYRGFWVPAPHIEFGCYLVRRVAKLRLDDERAARLSELYAKDPCGCQEQIALFWRISAAALIAEAARSGEWQPVRQSLRSLRAQMRNRAMLRNPVYVITRTAVRVWCAARSALKADIGLIVAFLGPDGAGKSSVIAALPHRMEGVFGRCTYHGFAPGLLTWLHPPRGRNERPHGVPPRPMVVSVARALLYWLLYYQLPYRLTMRRDLARSTLVIHDRHLIDAAVDPWRYRYGGPSLVIHAIWWSMRKPDLVILLDVPAEILQQRKQEVPPDESARQRQAYRSLVERMQNGRIIDASQNFDDVLDAVDNVVLEHLARRTRRLLDWRRHRTSSARSFIMPTTAAGRD
jgi:thymidylate kinase